MLIYSKLQVNVESNEQKCIFKRSANQAGKLGRQRLQPQVQGLLVRYPGEAACLVL